jgi:O-methyltransferase involved in polyketide biosynthesis
MNEKQTAIKALMLMGTLLAYVDPHETTRAIDKIKRNVRKGLTTLYRSDRSLYAELSKDADRIWEKAKLAANDTGYTVSLPAMLNAIWSALDGNRYQTMWFTENTYQRAMSSMAGVSVRDDDVQIESDSYFLTDIFTEGLGLQKKKTLGRIAAQAKVKNARIRERKAYERT